MDSDLTHRIEQAWGGGPAMWMLLELSRAHDALAARVADHIVDANKMAAQRVGLMDEMAAWIYRNWPLFHSYHTGKRDECPATDCREAAMLLSRYRAARERPRVKPAAKGGDGCKS